MSRSLPGGVQTIIDGAHATLCHLVELEFASGTVYLTDAGADVTWEGQTFTDTGNMGQMEPVRESAAGEATGIRFQLAGPLSSYVSAALQEHVQGNAARVYVAFFNASHVVVGRVLEWSGLIDTMTVSDSTETAVIQITAESRMIDWQRPRTRRHNHEDLQVDYPGDRFYEHVPNMVEKEIVWPAASYFRQ